VRVRENVTESVLGGAAVGLHCYRARGIPMASVRRNPITRSEILGPSQLEGPGVVCGAKSEERLTGFLRCWPTQSNLLACADLGDKARGREQRGHLASRYDAVDP
jgi:hypothetical protein